MPLPQITGLPPTLTTLHSLLLSQWSSISTYLQLPSRNEYVDAWSHAVRDAISASTSVANLIYLTFRPLTILLALMLRYVWMVSKVILHHLLGGFIAAAHEGYNQATVAVKWFVKVQSNLSRGALLIEAGVMGGLIAAWMVRRHIRKRKYAERMGRWYRGKKRSAIRRYNDLIDTISRTSLLLAALLPHVLYIVAVGSIKYVAPRFVSYLASRTYLTSALSIWHPFVVTVSAIHKFRCRAAQAQAETKKEAEKEVGKEMGRKGSDGTEGEGGSDKQDVAGAAVTTAAPSSMSSSRNKKRNVGPSKSKSKLADRWLRAASSRNDDANGDDGAGGELKGFAPLKKESFNEATTTTTLEEDAMDLLKYWVVYALLSASYRALCLLPIVGRIVPVVGRAVAATSSNGGGGSNGAGRWGRFAARAGGNGGGGGGGWIPRLSSTFVEEVQMVFFVWLRLLPSSMTTPSYDSSFSSYTSSGGGGVGAKTTMWEKKLSSTRRKRRGTTSTKRRRGGSYANRPLDVLYARMAPVATSVANTSAVLLKKAGVGRGGGNDSSSSSSSPSSGGGALGTILGKLRSILDLAVLVRLLSSKTKDKILTTFAESTSLLPPAMTLLMPSYFTKFGCIYVSQVLPAANSSMACDALQVAVNDDHLEHDRDRLDKEKDEATNDAVRYLQYWIVSTILSDFVLASFAPILRWVPLSVHATWLLWAYVQLESTTRRWYGIFEWELMAFGLLDSRSFGGGGDGQDGGVGELDVDKTVTVRAIRRLTSSLPSGVSSSIAEDDDEKRNGSSLVASTHDLLKKDDGERHRETDDGVNRTDAATNGSSSSNSREDTKSSSVPNGVDPNQTNLAPADAGSLGSGSDPLNNNARNKTSAPQEDEVTSSNIADQEKSKT